MTLDYLITRPAITLDKMDYVKWMSINGPTPSHTYVHVLDFAPLTLSYWIIARARKTTPTRTP